ncbi:hypothetical protein CTAYLR_004112 [Chrysophaeum taylorii]|uniref:Uncharacterized protein n=1 Tax=Chrysophaeum taylorii TaxID=2483200 RepID=A0AAD7UD32_9STRA|nr:hypothetical protein CTAYLR_004112 [Chrysophaeum taylorii]
MSSSHENDDDERQPLVVVVGGKGKKRRSTQRCVWFGVVGLLSASLVGLSLVRNFRVSPPSKNFAACEECGDEKENLCEAVSVRSNAYALCFSACVGGKRKWMAQCAWQAVSRLRATCAGEFQPTEPDSYGCGDARETCLACSSSSSSTCGKAAEHGAIRALDENLDELCEKIGVPKRWTTPLVMEDYSLQSAWRTSAPVLEIEEHYLYGRPFTLSSVFVKQAYAFWRYVLNSDTFARGRGVSATTRAYGDRGALMTALSQRELKPGALVFVDVIFEAMDTDWDFDILKEDVDPKVLLQTGDLEASPLTAEPNKERALDYLCVYHHTPDLLKRSALLRALLAYEDPLVLVLAGDADCRLKKLPRTHHTVIFPNDGGAATRAWWPEGLEGLDNLRDLGPVQSPGGFAADALSIASRSDAAAGGRPYLVDCGLSVTPRKPSRVTLLSYLERNADELVGIAKSANLNLRIEVSVSRLDSTPERSFVVATNTTSSSSGDAWFSLAPAGDTWSSGRILEAMLRGTIPIVDETYLADGISQKGCGDAARFWREGSPEFPHPAPFVFVRKWADLPSAILEAGALDNNLLEARVAAVRDYKQKLFSHLRSSTLDAIQTAQRAPGTSRCTTTPLNQSQAHHILRDAKEYYRDPEWFDHFTDAPTWPGSGCTTKYYTDGRKTHGAMCFDPACAPPTISSFDCHDTTTTTTTT